MTLTLATSLSELPEYRGVLLTLIARDLKVKYQTKALGFLWSLLYPALMVGIWYVVFRKIARIEMPSFTSERTRSMTRAMASANGVVLVSCEPMWQSTPTISIPLMVRARPYAARASAAAIPNLLFLRPVEM